MSSSQALIAILIMALVTALLRFIPFIIFGRKETPELISYLGKVLPCAVMAMLVVYCLKDLRFSTYGDWLPAFAGVVVTIFIQTWKRKSIYSILAGTIVYMLLIRII